MISAAELAVLVTSEIAPAGTVPYSAEWHSWRGVAATVIRAARRHAAKARNAGRVQCFIFDDEIKELVPIALCKSHGHGIMR